MLTECAPAKLNLTLNVTGRRADGYHLLHSLVVFAGAHDVITAREPTGDDGADLSLTLSGPFAGALEPDADNLVLRAARALGRKAGVPARASLHLVKNLPVASGIGGGSSDAAATLRVLHRLWDLALEEQILHELAASLGADVPVCLRPAPRLMSGIGEILQPVPPMPDCAILLVNPGVALSTRDVFEARRAPFSQPAAMPPSWPDAASLAASLAQGANDLEAPAIGLCPLIGETLRWLAGRPGALLSRMSGSGATCFALFATVADAREAARELPSPDWWCWAGPLYEQAADT